jgi:hypothetical protein
MMLVNAGAATPEHAEKVNREKKQKEKRRRCMPRIVGVFSLKQ